MRTQPDFSSESWFRENIIQLLGAYFHICTNSSNDTGSSSEIASQCKEPLDYFRQYAAWVYTRLPSVAKFNMISHRAAHYNCALQKQSLPPPPLFSSATGTCAKNSLTTCQIVIPHLTRCYALSLSEGRCVR